MLDIDIIMIILVIMFVLFLIILILITNILNKIIKFEKNVESNYQLIIGACNNTIDIYDDTSSIISTNVRNYSNINNKLDKLLTESININTEIKKLHKSKSNKK